MDLVNTPISVEELQELHKLSFNNKDSIKKWVTLRCFHCMYRTMYTFVKATTLPRGKDTGTALCPNCSVDALVPGKTPEHVIEAMHYYYFADTEYDY